MKISKFLLLVFCVATLPLQAGWWWPFGGKPKIDPDKEWYAQLVQEQLANPYDPLINYNLGVLAYKSGNNALAQASFERVIESGVPAEVSIRYRSAINSGNLYAKSSQSTLEGLKWQEKRIPQDILNAQIGGLDRALERYELVDESFDQQLQLPQLKQSLHTFKNEVLKRQKELEKQEEEKKKQQENQKRNNDKKQDGQDTEKDGSQADSQNDSGGCDRSGDSSSGDDGQNSGKQKQGQNPSDFANSSDSKGKTSERQKQERQKSSEGNKQSSDEKNQDTSLGEDENSENDSAGDDSGDKEQQKQSDGSDEQESSGKDLKDSSGEKTQNPNDAQQQEQQRDEQSEKDVDATQNDAGSANDKDHPGGKEEAGKESQADEPASQSLLDDRSDAIDEEASKDSLGQEENLQDLAKRSAAAQAKGDRQQAQQGDDQNAKEMQQIDGAEQFNKADPTDERVTLGKDAQQAEEQAQKDALGGDDVVMWHDENASESSSEKVARVMLQKLANHEGSLQRQRLAQRARFSGQTRSSGQKNW